MSSERAAEIRGERGTLRGIVHSCEGPVCGAVLVLHGFFSSTRVGPARLYVQIARRLQRHHVNVWRFDCYGVGDSDGDFADTSFRSELEDYTTLIKAMRAAEAAPVGLLGHSMGTSLAVMLAQKDTRIRRVVLISPTLTRISWLRHLFSREQLAELRASGRTVRKGIEINREFIEELQSERALKVAATLTEGSTIIYGTADEFYSRDSVRRTARALRSQVIEIDGADHNFLTPGSRDALLKCLESEVEAWPERKP